MQLSIIVAISENGAIGYRGALPWHLSADLRRFKRLTMGHHLLMGRKTFESIGHPLPGRTSLVITRQTDYAVLHSESKNTFARAVIGFQQAIDSVVGDTEAFVIGGAQIYQLALPSADRIYLTRVRTVVTGDVFFPTLRWEHWKTVHEEQQEANDRNDFAHSFQILDRTTGT